MLKKITQGIIGLLSFTLSTAYAMEKPETCPSVGTLKSTGINTIIPVGTENMYFGYTTGYFDTENSWFFVIGPLNSESETDALSKANEALVYLSGKPVPVNDEDNGWMCLYQLTNQLTAAAFMNATQSPYKFSPLTIQRLMNQHKKD